MAVSRRRFAVGTAAALAAPAAFASRPASAETKIALACSPANDFLPAFVAKEQGFFAKRGLDVAIQIVPLAPTIPGAMRGGSVDVGSVTPPALLQSDDSGLDLVTVCGGTVQSHKNPTVSIVVRKDAGIKTAGDLRGKSVGVPGFNSELDVVFRKWLKDKKIDSSALQLRETSFPNMLDQLSGKALDAVLVLEPFRSRIIAAGAGEKFADYFDDVRDNLGFVYWCSTREWAEKHASDVKNFRAALGDGVEYIAKNPAPAREIEVKYLKVAAPTFSTYALDVSRADLQWYSDLGRDLGMLKAPADVNKIVYVAR